jgi:cytochrome c553
MISLGPLSRLSRGGAKKQTHMRLVNVIAALVGVFIAVPAYQSGSGEDTHSTNDPKALVLRLFTAYAEGDNRVARFEEATGSGDIVDAFIPADPDRGKALYTTCAGCHGNWAQGRPEMHAPNLTGVDAGYVTRQLRLFRDSLRGGKGDTYGFMMVGRAGALPGDRGVRDVAAYIETLPTSPQRGSADHGPTRGRLRFAACAPCHGENAEGRGETGAPSLRQLDGEYLIRQLRNFRSGVRGSEPEDVAGQQMRLAARALASDAVMRDVVAYIETL